MRSQFPETVRLELSFRSFAKNERSSICREAIRYNYPESVISKFPWRKIANVRWGQEMEDRFQGCSALSQGKIRNDKSCFSRLQWLSALSGKISAETALIQSWFFLLWKFPVSELFQRKSALFSSESALFQRESALFQRWFLALKICVFSAVQSWISAVQRFSGNEQRWNRPEIILNQSWKYSESELISAECLWDVNPGKFDLLTRLWIVLGPVTEKKVYCNSQSNIVAENAIWLMVQYKLWIFPVTPPPPSRNNLTPLRTP